MSKPKTLKIKKPKLSGVWALMIGSVVTSIALAVLIFGVVSYYSDPEHTLSIDFLGISADFFKTAEKPPEVEGMDGLTLDNEFFKLGKGQDSASGPSAQTTDKNQLTKEEAEQAIKDAKAKAELKKLKNKYQTLVKKQAEENKKQNETEVRQKITLSSDDPNKNIIPVGTLTILDLNRLLNESRRGMVIISSIDDLSGLNVKKIEKDVIQEHQFWQEEATQASKPIDMTRILHVAKHIPAILENRINSQLPGKIIAQISENIFGGHGRTILIPAGTKAVGRYYPIQKQDRKSVV